MNRGTGDERVPTLTKAATRSTPPESSPTASFLVAPVPAHPTTTRPRTTRVLSAVAMVVAVGLLLILGVGVGGTLLGSPNTKYVTSSLNSAVADISSSLADGNAELDGTGVVISSSGAVLTNNHVIEDADSIRVRDVGDGRTYAATVLGADPTDDLAVLQIEGAPHVERARLGHSSTLSTGEAVYALGNAGGAGGKPVFTTGTIVGLRRSIVVTNQISRSVERLAGVVETDVPLVPGDSGGPLANSSGQLIGIDTAADTGQHRFTGSPLAFAIPIDKAIAVARAIQSGRGSSTVHLAGVAAP